MNITKAVVSVSSALYLAGHRCDGTPFHAESFGVWVTMPDGTRYEHAARFAGCAVEQDEEGYSHFGDIREEATAKAEKLAARVRKAGVIDLAHWGEIDPEYGSEAYQAQGIEEQRAFADRFDY